MKTWTVVIELNEMDDMSKQNIEDMVSTVLQYRSNSFRIMETIPAPYGPQKPGGVFLSESKVK